MFYYLYCHRTQSRDWQDLHLIKMSYILRGKLGTGVLVDAPMMIMVECMYPDRPTYIYIPLTYYGDDGGVHISSYIHVYPSFFTSLGTKKGRYAVLGVLWSNKIPSLYFL